MKEIIELYNIRILTCQLEGCRGYSQKKGDGYVVLVAEHLSDEAKERTLWHELIHIVLGHFDDRRELTVKEKEQEVQEMMEEYFHEKINGIEFVANGSA